MLDEVESITFARNASLKGNEPGDSLRVVNAVLTQLDQLKLYSNVLILATSNMTDAVDEAFLDRADLVTFMKNPTSSAIYSIFSECVEALKRANVISDLDFSTNTSNKLPSSTSSSSKLLPIANLLMFPSLADPLSKKLLEVSLCLEQKVAIPLNFSL